MISSQLGQTVGPDISLAEPDPIQAIGPAPTTPYIGRRTHLFRAAGNVAKVFSLEVGARIVGQLALLFVARMLQPESFGTFLVASTAFSIVLILADFGIQDLALQALSGRETHNNEHRAFTSARLKFAFLGTVFSLPTIFILWELHSHYTAVPLLFLGLFPAVYISNFNIKYRIHKQYGRAGLASASFVVLLAVGSLGGAIINRSSELASLGAFSALALGAVLWAIVGREPLVKLSIADLRVVSRDSRPFLLAGLCVALYSRGDRFFVAWLVGSFDAGLYGAAYSLIFAASLLTLAVQAVALPKLLGSWQRGATWRADSRRFLIILFGLGLLIGTTVLAASGPLVHIMYGDPFSGAVPLTRVLCPLIPLYFVNTGLGTCLLACKRQRALARITFANLMVGAVCFPVFTVAMGASGTAMASVLVEVTGFFMLVRVLKATFETGALSRRPRRREGTVPSDLGAGLQVLSVAEPQRIGWRSPDPRHRSTNKR